MSKPVRIQRKRSKGFNLQLSSPNGLPVLYVGRPTKWGNPHRPEDWHGSAHEAVKQYWYMMLPKYYATPEYFDELRGKNLACWCPLDQPCHANMLLQILESNNNAST